MIVHLPAWLFLIPFAGAISMPLVGSLRRDLCRPLTLGLLGLTTVLSVVAFQRVVTHGPIRYVFGAWATPLGIEWLLDGLSAMVMVVISAIAFLALTYAGPVYPDSVRVKTPLYHTLVLLLVSGLTGIVLSADLFNLFVFLELTSLSSYALVASPGGRATLSAFRYLILGTIGASLYVLGTGYFYAVTGTLNMADIAERVPALIRSPAFLTGLVLMLAGLGIKAALFPLHGWLPDAYTDAPDAVSPLIAPLVTKAALYAIARIAYWVIGPDVVTTGLPVALFLGWLAALATVVGAFLALSQHNLKRMFAYGGVSHIGLTLMGLTMTNRTGFAGGLFYLVTDAVMQAALFFFAGAVLCGSGVRTLSELPMARRHRPWVHATLIITALSMIGIPPTGGFFGKWYIVLGALETGNYVAVLAIVSATLLTLAYFSRVIEGLFLTSTSEPEASDPGLPWPMHLSMGVLSAMILLLGLLSDQAIALILRFAIPEGL